MGIRAVKALTQFIKTQIFLTKPQKTSPWKQKKRTTIQRSGFRVVVEHIFGDIKAFKIMPDRYRNKRKRYNLKFNIISGIMNMNNGFLTDETKKRDRAKKNSKTK